MNYRFYIILVFSLAIMASSCSEDCREDAADNQIEWEKTRPSHYSFEYRASCFCSLESIGPYYVEITESSIDTAYFIGSFDGQDSVYFEFINDFEMIKTIVSNNTMDAYFERFADQGNSSDFDCEIDFNDQYHFIEKYQVNPPDDIADGGFFYEVSNFMDLD